MNFADPSIALWLQPRVIEGLKQIGILLKMNGRFICKDHKIYINNH
jgi:hypothetical protein